MSAFLLQNNGPDFSKTHDGLVPVKAKLSKKLLRNHQMFVTQIPIFVTI